MHLKFKTSRYALALEFQYKTSHSVIILYVKHPQSYKIYFLEDNYLFTIYVQFILLTNVVFLKKANNWTCPSYNIRKYGRHVKNVNTTFGCLRRTFSWEIIHPKAIKSILLKINYLFTIYVQFIWLANVVFLKNKRIIEHAQVIILIK